MQNSNSNMQPAGTVMPNSSRTELVQAYIKNIKNANTEAAKKEIFISFLTRLFDGPESENILSQFTQGAEKSICNIARNGRHSDYGRADTQYGNIIIEFENDLGRTGLHAVEQLKEYLSGNWNTGIKGRFTLMASDCLCWRVYALDFNTLHDPDHMSAEQINLRMVHEFCVTQDKADEFYFFLDRYLFENSLIPATLEEIRNRFGHDSDIFQSAIINMRKAYKDLENSPEMTVARAQWEKFLRIAYGKFDASIAIFLIHSYLSVLAKMLAYHVITDDKYISDDEIPEILAGGAFRRLNVENFTENDFFRWTCGSNEYLRKAFRIIADGLAQIDFGNIHEDILKGVYQELVDDDTRHALGEHYTPDWLCALTVAEVKPEEGQKILDPSCGSGSFLKACANWLVAKNPQITAGALNDCLYGIDVHPLSVQISKATLLISYGKKLAAEAMPISLNIFLANSLLLPEEDMKLMGNTYTVAVDETRLDIPEKLFRDNDAFTALVNTAEILSEMDYRQDFEREDKSIVNIFKNRLNLAEQSSIRAGHDIYRALLKAKKTGRNGIWAYILANTFAPIAMKNRFDLVLGNPPWLTFRYITANEYQNEIKEIANRTKVMPNRDTLFTQLELAAVFAGHCVNYFLKAGGRLAFVMPRSIFVADQHHKMREGKILNLEVCALWDLAKVGKLFKVPSCVMFCKRNNTKKKNEISGMVFSGNLPKHNASLAEAEKKLKKRTVTFYLATLNNRNAWSESKIELAAEPYYKDLFKTGATLFPRCLCFVDIDQQIEGSLKNRLLKIKSAQAIYRDAKAPWKSVSISGTIHSKYLFETALASNLVPFGLTGTFLTALPIREGRLIDTPPH